MALTQKEQLESSLQKAAGLTRIAQSTDYTQYLLPYMEKLASPIPIDSTTFKTEAEYIHALKENNTRAKIYKEFIAFLANQEGIMNLIREKLKAPQKSHGI